METLPQIPEGLSAAWVIIGAALVACGYGAYRMWKFFSPSVKAEREQEVKVRRRTKRRLGRSYEWGEIAEQELYDGRTDRRKHDDQHHPDGDGAIGIRELPPALKHGIRDWASQGEDDES